MVVITQNVEQPDITKIMKPWGFIQKLNTGENYCVQMVHINAGERTSLHVHKKRSELWQCTKGNPKVLIFEHPDRLASAPLVTFSPGEVSQVKKDFLHRIDNRNAEDDAEIIEIQFGECAEDDIIRYQDDYSRITVPFPKPSLTIAKDTKDAKRILATPGKKIMKFTASWCGPCKAIAPDFRRLSAMHDSVAFHEIDVDVCDEFTGENEVQAMPTFVAFEDSTEIARFSGASLKELEVLVQKLVCHGDK